MWQSRDFSLDILWRFMQQIYMDIIEDSQYPHQRIKLEKASNLWENQHLDIFCPSKHQFGEEPDVCTQVDT